MYRGKIMSSKLVLEILNKQIYLNKFGMNFWLFDQ